MPGLFDKLASWFGEEPSQPSRGSAQREPAVASSALNAAPSEQTDDTVLRSRLRSVLGGPEVDIGCVQMVGLESLREKLGDRWEPVRDRVRTMVDRLFKAILSPNDVYFEHGEETYIVVFARLGEREAQLICGRIIEELHRKLLGDADLAAITVRSAVKAANGEILLETTNLAALLSAVAQTIRPSGPRSSDTTDTPVRKPRSAREGNDDDPTALPEVMYRPAWNVARQVLFLYIARPCRARPRQANVWGYEVVDDASDANKLLELDLMVMRSAIDTYRELYENRFRFFLSLPIHFESLAGVTRRQEVVRLVSEIPIHLQPFLNYQLEGVPDGVPEGRLREFVNALRPFGRSLTIAAAPHNRDLATYASAGVKGIGITLPIGWSIDRTGELTSLVTTARRSRLFTLVDGIPDAVIEAVAEGAGVDYLAGDFIGRWAAMPEHAVHRSRRDFGRRPAVA